jgi:ubiquinone/menaquinone biosynthesis C-methylase UbiE
MKEKSIQEFWQENPCGETLIDTDYQQDIQFFDDFDEMRYSSHAHLPTVLDGIPFEGQKVLEIGIGQGADAEQIIRRGGQYTGLDLTHEAVSRVRRRFELKKLSFDDVVQGSILDAPFEDNQFDVVFSHGVLHHVPDILKAQEEIARILKPGGLLVVMLYARHSLNYHLSIRLLRRAALALAYSTGKVFSGKLARHLELAREQGLLHYLNLNNFTHRNTDGPNNPYALVYDLKDVARDFPLFKTEDSYKNFRHAPPLPVSKLPGDSLWGWHLWVHMRHCSEIKS